MYHRYYMCVHCGKTYNSVHDRRVTRVDPNLGLVGNKMVMTHSFLEQSHLQGSHKPKRTTVESIGEVDEDANYDEDEDKDKSFGS